MVAFLGASPTYTLDSHCFSPISLYIEELLRGISTCHEQTNQGQHSSFSWIIKGAPQQVVVFHLLHRALDEAVQQRTCRGNEPFTTCQRRTLNQSQVLTSFPTSFCVYKYTNTPITTPSRLMYVKTLLSREDM